MIAAWMIYTLAVSLLLLAGASAAEYVARALRAPTRVVWATAMMAAVVLSARGLVNGFDTRRETQNARRNTAIAVAVGTLNGGGAESAAGHPARSAAGPGIVARFLGTGRAAVAAIHQLEQSAAQIDVRPLDRWNGLLVGVWIGASSIALLMLVGSFVRMRRIERGLAPAMVCDYPVLVSRHLGPAVLGVLHPRIVLPEWVLALPGRERDAVLTHEREHAAAFDPLLLTAAVCLIALQPWNIALWGLLTRLRVALEADCDRRVLDAISDDRRWYGRLLISVYERTAPGPSLSIGFVTRPSNLERRIRRIARRPRVVSVSGAVSSLAAAMLVMTACRAAAPVRRDVSTPAKSAVLAQTERPAAVPVLEAAPRVMRTEPSPDTRCTLSSRRAERGHTVLWPGQWPVSAGCSIYGDIVVLYVDSANVLVAARDTADVGITAFFVFETTPGTTAPDLVWSTTSGRAALSDTTMSFGSSTAGTRRLVLRLKGAATGASRADVLELSTTNMMMAEMSGISWETIAALPNSRRCTPAERESESIPGLGPPRSSPSPDDKMVRACFVTRGQRFEFPILRWRKRT